MSRLPGQLLLASVWATFPAAQEGCELAPTAAFPSPTLQFSESRAHRPSLFWSFGATKPALFNTGFSYLGWRINSTIIKSIKYTKLDFFQGWLQEQVDNQKVFRKTGNSVCCVEISLNLKNIPVPHHPLAEYFRQRDVFYFISRRRTFSKGLIKKAFSSGLEPFPPRTLGSLALLVS